jgi:hypothetical protein
MPTKNTKPIHKEAPEKTVFLLLDHPSGEANTTGTPITNKKEITIRANTANWKAIITLSILQTYSNMYTVYYNSFLSDLKRKSSSKM